MFDLDKFKDRINQKKEEKKYLKEIEKAAYQEALEEVEGKTFQDKIEKAAQKGRDRAAFKSLSLNERIKIVSEKQKNMYKFNR